MAFPSEEEESSYGLLELVYLYKHLDPPSLPSQHALGTSASPEALLSRQYRLKEEDGGRKEEGEKGH